MRLLRPRPPTAFLVLSFITGCAVTPPSPGPSDVAPPPDATPTLTDAIPLEVDGALSDGLEATLRSAFHLSGARGVSAVPDLEPVVTQIGAASSSLTLEVVSTGEESAHARTGFIPLPFGARFRFKVTNRGPVEVQVAVLFVSEGRAYLVGGKDTGGLYVGPNQSGLSGTELEIAPPAELMLAFAVGLTGAQAGAFETLENAVGQPGGARLVAEILNNRLEASSLARGRPLPSAAVGVIGHAPEEEPLEIDQPPAQRLRKVLARHHLPGTRVLIYVPQGEDLHAHVVDSSGVLASAPIGGGWGSLEPLLRDLHQAMRLPELSQDRAPVRTEAPASPGPPSDHRDRGAHRVRTAAPRQTVDEAARELSRVLLPVEVQRALEGTTRLLVVPTHGIGAIPWPLLGMGVDERPIVERFPVTIAPGLLALLQPPAPWQPGFESPLVVGDPEPMKAPGWHLLPLPGARAEAEMVAQALGTRPLLGAAATPGRISARSEQADLLYVATHGISDPEDPLGGSFLVLARGPWTAASIMLQGFPRARLAVLSACQTGLGRYHPGGVMGLARSFQIAGAPRVVMSLWNVDDLATAELMTAFMHELNQHPPAEALRRAMMQTRSKHPHPAKWASFAVFGDG